MNKNLCILPWVSLETSSLGTVRPCCLAQEDIKKDDGTAYQLTDASLGEIFNSNYMKQLRQRFLNGEKPETCSRCWDEEAVGRNSKRINSMTRLRHLVKSVDFTTDTADKIIFADLKLGNICNLKCRICGSFSSSKWAQEEIDIWGDSRAKDNLAQGRWPRESAAFWQDLESQLQNIRYMEFTGGEPFLIDEHFDLLQIAVDLGIAKNIEIHYNTNGSTFPKRGLELWPHFRLVEIALSIDDLGNRFEYQRYGTKWETVLDNLAKFKELRANNKNIRLQHCLTVNVQNFYYLDELIQWAVQQNFDYIHFNMLHDAWYFSIKNLTKEAKELITNKLSNKELPYQHEIDKLLEFMNSHPDNDCKHLNKILKTSDVYRKQKFSDDHKEIADAIGY